MGAVDPGMATVSDAERVGLAWQKASVSTSYGACVELAAVVGGVAMRDSKDPDGPILLYARAEFRAFLDGARNGDFSSIGRVPG